MKLKYYLRGIGIGVIVATLIMTVSSVIHNNNLSDETIIKEAQKLGMIMPENTEDNNSLWGDTSEEETQKDSEVSTENTDGNNTVSDKETQISENTQTSEETQTSEDTQTSEETQTSENTQTPEDTQQPVDENMAVVTITDSDAARHVSEKLQAAGLIEDSVEFRNYLADHGYATDIISGTFQIPKGSTYKEICDIIIKK